MERTLPQKSAERLFYRERYIMKILILSCNTGGGHNAAANALKKYFTDRHIPCDITDALAYISENFSKLISNGHVFVYRNLPKPFGVAYRYEENHPPKMIYKILSNAAEPLYEDIKMKGYDAVLSTHVFSSMILTEIKRRYRTSVKTYFVATDYTCSPGVGDLDTDLFFTPHKGLNKEFIQRGVSASKIVPCGIPVKDAFFPPIEREKAREMLQFPQDARILLLSCGSMGAGPMKKLATKLVDRLDKRSYLVVVCGTNNRLCKDIRREMRGRSNVRVLGYTSQIERYMAAADLFLTKPGGLSSSEAFYQRLPMIVINAVPGCETRNLEFFKKMSLAETADSVDAIVDLAITRLTDKKYLAWASKNIAMHFSQNPTQAICETVIAAQSPGKSKEENNQ